MRWWIYLKYAIVQLIQHSKMTTLWLHSVVMILTTCKEFVTSRSSFRILNSTMCKPGLSSNNLLYYFKVCWLCEFHWAIPFRPYSATSQASWIIFCTYNLERLWKIQTPNCTDILQVRNGGCLTILDCCWLSTYGTSDFGGTVGSDHRSGATNCSHGHICARGHIH